MKRKKNNKNFIALFTLFIFSISVGYAFLNTLLSITGIINVKGNTWNLYYENIVVKYGSVTASLVPVADSTEYELSLQFSLLYPGEYYEFTVDVVNDGTVDAYLDSYLITPVLTDSQKNYVNYSVTYQNDEPLQKGQLVPKGEYVRLKFRMEHRTDYTDSQMWFDDITASVKLNYIPDRGQGVLVKNNGVKVTPIANGSLDEVGTIVTIDDQQFYTIGTEGDNVKLLAMYNLYVGGQYSVNDNTWTAYGDEATGMQSVDMIGYYSDDSELSQYNKYKGITPFSSEEQKGTNNNSYNGSIVEGYVNNYKNLLESKFGVDVVEARLITYDELKNSETFSCSTVGSCTSSKYSWIYSTSYWVNYTNGSVYVWNIYSDGRFNCNNYSSAKYFGVRPVIVLKKSDIVVDVKPIVNGDINEIGTIVKIGSEQFYTIGTEGDNVKLLSMYNLYVGGQYVCSSDNSCKWTAYGNEATGMQKENMQGMIYGENIRNGTTAFSSSSQKGTYYSSYNGSIVEGYVNNYKSLLESRFKIEIVEARLFTTSELIDEQFGCNLTTKECITSFNWIYSTSYWTGSSYDSSNIWCVHTNGSINYASYDSAYITYGVRPVLVISKSLF